MERLDKLLAGTGRWSRREVKELVRRGQVRVDGVIAAAAEQKIDPSAAVTVAGETVALGGCTYLLLHKPAGVLTATEDRRQPTVLELLPAEYRRRGIAPVGRLDKDTTGLLLLTDDGELAHRLLSPKYHVDKRYLAQVDGALGQADVEAFAGGITLADGTECLPAELELLPEHRCIVTLRQGKFHQVKRMFEALGKRVIYLKRISMGPLKLPADLKTGTYRALTQAETDMLMQIKSGK